MHQMRQLFRNLSTQIQSRNGRVKKGGEKAMIRINIDGKEISGYQGQTILDVARAQGIEIPTLCYDERVKIYGACGLCVVETEGNPKLLRACATEISPGMVILTDTPRVRESRKLTLELLLSDHSGDCQGPCRKACPAGTDVQGYVGLIANGKYKEALKVIKRKIPLPASIGRVCPHPCEEACRRQLVEEPIAIAQLKYLAADMDLKSDNPYIPELKAAGAKKVAIIGAGPAGLTAAYYLAIEGHAVTVYDAMPKAGGMLRYGIPEYRLPKSILQKEIDLIAKMGVKFVFNTKIGKDISLEHLRSQNDALFIGIGAWESSPMRCKGEDLPGVLGGIDFLREAATFGKVAIGDKVAIVGGGNTAMDAARTALRLGAEKVMVLYRRTRAEMPAEEMEIKEAEEEGIAFKFLVAPLEITAAQGKVNAIRLQQMELGAADASGRRSPVPITGAEETIPVDTIISAIGQKVKADGLEQAGLSKWGTIAADDKTLVTNLPGVFAGGDGVTGPKIAVDAIAQGRLAAESILKYLKGEALSFKAPYMVEQKGLTNKDFAQYERTPRIEMPHLSPNERRTNFREVNLGLAKEAAVKEANRCLECGCKDFYECKLIKYANQYEVKPERIAGSKREEKLKEIHPFIERNSEKCILCGLCVRICDEVMGVTALGLVHRGFESIVEPEFNLALSDTGCISCGQCVTVCPTGALMENLPLPKNLPLKMEETPSVCSFCNVGCAQVINTCAGTVLRALPPAGEVLCRQGRFAFETFNDERLTKPLVRRNNALVETTWEEAFKQVLKTAQSISARKGSSALGMFISPSWSCEEAGAAIALGQKGFKMNKLSSFTPNSVSALARVLGSHIFNAQWEELSSTDLILMVGSFNESQSAAVKIRQAVGEGARLIIVANEPTLADNLAEFKIDPVNSTVFIKEIQAAMLKKGLLNKEAAKIEGYAELKKNLAAITPSKEAETIAGMYGKAGKAIIVADGNTVSSAGVEDLANLVLMTGRADTVRNGIIVVQAGSNPAGVWALGARTAHKDMIEEMKAGSLKGIFIMGEDPVGAGLLTAGDFKPAELTVVMTPFMTATAALADVVLPAAIPAETEGTYLRADGRTLYFGQITEPLAILNNRDIIAALAEDLQIRISGIKQDNLEERRPEFKKSEDARLFTRPVICDPTLIKFNEKIGRAGLK
jgi:formate dehydrogenase major subunit